MLLPARLLLPLLQPPPPPGDVKGIIRVGQVGDGLWRPHVALYKFVVLQEGEAVGAPLCLEVYPANAQEQSAGQSMPCPPQQAAQHALSHTKMIIA